MMDEILNQECTDKTRCVFVGGDWNGRTMTVGLVKTLKLDDGVVDKPTGHRIFFGAPKIKGYIGPMTGGKFAPLRYESPDVYNLMSI